jgi:predicted nucleic acid-binding protein
MHTFTCFLDANVIFSSTLTNFLLCLADRELYRPRWSEQVLGEWLESALEKHAHLTRQKLEYRRQQMDRAFPDSLVKGYEDLMEGLQLPDPKDRHLLAAAIRGGAGLIVTKNLKDFPADYLSQYGIEAQHPDTFVYNLISMHPEGVLEAVRFHRESLTRPPIAVEDYLISIYKQELVKTVDYLGKYRHFI